jgi:hypothetical protein
MWNTSDVDDDSKWWTSSDSDHFLSTDIGDGLDEKPKTGWMSQTTKTIMSCGTVLM